MFYDWFCIFYGWLVEYPCVAVCPSLCVGKKDKKEIKPLGPLWGTFDKIFCFYIRETGKVLWRSITTLLTYLWCLLEKP
jgi:hypothetical protein